MVMKDTIGFSTVGKVLRVLKPEPHDQDHGHGDAGESDVEALRQAARIVARAEVADAVTEALNSYGGSLRDLQKVSGLDPAFVSKLANGKVNKQGATVASLAQIALAMNKSLKIVIE